VNEHPRDELLHGALDGTLSEAQAERLRKELAADAALRERAARLQRVKDMLDGLGPAEPPGELVDRVMAAVAEGAPVRPSRLLRFADRVVAGRHQLFNRRVRHFDDNDSGDTLRWTTGMAGGGGNVAKKTLWAVAGLAAATILVVVYFNGTRSLDQGAQGTIGAADRYRGAQPTSVAAKEGNAQKFLQSDTFDRLLKDKNVRALLADKEMCALLASPEIQAALQRPDAQALQDESVEAALRNAKLQAALQDESVGAALRSVDLQAALQDQTVDAALRSAKLQAALEDENVQAALRNKNVRTALEDAEAVQAALKGRKSSLAANDDFQAALKNAKFRALLGDDAFEAALKNAKFRGLLADDAFEAALKNAKFRALIADDGFQAALRQGPLMGLLASDADFQAALRDSGAMEAALRRAK
jgi:hypothetical protein